MADETDPNNPPQEVVPQPPLPPPGLEVAPDTLLLARAMVFPGVAALYPARPDKDLVAKTCDIVEALRVQPQPIT